MIQASPIALTDKAPPTVMGLARLAKTAFDGSDLAPLHRELAARVARDNTDVSALMDLCLLDQMTNNTERGLVFQAYALSLCRVYRISSTAGSPQIRLLGFVIAGQINANTPIEFLIENSDISLTLLYLVSGQPLPPVPNHDLAFVLIGESDRSREILREMERLITNWPCPVLNLPDRIPQLGRERLSEALRGVSGAVIPATIRANHATLEAIGSETVEIEGLVPDGGFPLIVRPLDSHAGQGLEKIEGASELTSYLSRHHNSEFYVSRFIDYRSPDGLYRKYRIAVIQGKAFPSHMGISERWMIHYLNAGMLESEAKRREEERFMDRFHEDFGRHHGAAIAEIAQITRLDYFGIDCGETPDGKLLVFEADTAQVVHNMDDPTTFPYKGPHMQSLFEAFHAMIAHNAGQRMP